MYQNGTYHPTHSEHHHQYPSNLRRYKDWTRFRSSFGNLGWSEIPLQSSGRAKHIQNWFHNKRNKGWAIQYIRRTTNEEPSINEDKLSVLHMPIKIEEYEMKYQQPMIFHLLITHLIGISAASVHLFYFGGRKGAPTTLPATAPVNPMKSSLEKSIMPCEER